MRIKYLSLVLVCLVIFGCAEPDRDKIYTITHYTKLCIEGVVYYSFGHGKAPAYTPDGKLVLCKRPDKVK